VQDFLDESLGMCGSRRKAGKKKSLKSWSLASRERAVSVLPRCGGAGFGLFVASFVSSPVNHLPLQ
jgi:hypothetical protein